MVRPALQPDRAHAAPAAMAGQRAAARVARRLAAIIRRGVRIRLRDAAATTALASTVQHSVGDLSFDLTDMPAAASGHATARAPRPPTRPAAARRPSGKPGRSPGRPGAPGSLPAFVLIAPPRTRAAGVCRFQSHDRPASADVNRS